MNRRMAVWAAGLALAGPAWAENVQQDDRRLQDGRIRERLDEAERPKTATVPKPAPQEQADSIVLDENGLLQQPELLQRALAAAVLYRNAEDARYLSALYRRLPENRRQPELLRWAEAVSEADRGRYRQALKHYRSLLADYPQHKAIRFQTAAVLFADRDYETAQQQFQKLRSEPDLPPLLAGQADRYLQEIRRQHRWQAYGSANYIADRNINQAPDNPDLGGNWRSDGAERASGFALQAGVSKKWIRQGGAFAELRLDGGGKYYWDASHYNEAYGRISGGLGYQNARHTVAVLPYWEKSWYAGGRKDSDTLKGFSRGRGIGAEWQYRPHPQWQIDGRTEYGRTRHNERLHLNGHSRFAALTASYQANARRIWQLGVDYTRTDTRDPDDAFTRRGIRFAWIQEWPVGLSTRIGAGYGRRHYHGPMPVFNHTQHNREYSLQTAVWHRNIHFFGITPRLVWQHTRNDSSIPLYTYRKNRLFVELSKQF